MALRLHTSRGRKNQSRLIVFGEREVQRAINSNLLLDEVFVSPLVDDATIANLELETADSTQVIRLTNDVFSKLAYGDRTEGLIATANRPETSLEMISDQASLVLVLQAIEKPGNLGAIVRSADGAGVCAVVLVDPLTDFFHPNAIRSSTGTVFSMNVAACSSQEAQLWLGENQFQIHTAMLENATDFYGADLRGKVAIVLGNEANGLDEKWAGDSFSPVKLPMLGSADSLNVSVTASILVYEAMRQRNR